MNRERSKNEQKTEKRNDFQENNLRKIFHNPFSIFDISIFWLKEKKIPLTFHLTAYQSFSLAESVFCKTFYSDANKALYYEHVPISDIQNSSEKKQ